MVGFVFEEVSQTLKNLTFGKSNFGGFPRPRSLVRGKILHSSEVARCEHHLLAAVARARRNIPFGNAVRVEYFRWV
jgi:hypothetical protein